MFNIQYTKKKYKVKNKSCKWAKLGLDTITVASPSPTAQQAGRPMILGAGRTVAGTPPGVGQKYVFLQSRSQTPTAGQQQTTAQLPQQVQTQSQQIKVAQVTNIQQTKSVLSQQTTTVVQKRVVVCMAPTNPVNTTIVAQVKSNKMYSNSLKRITIYLFRFDRWIQRQSLRVYLWRNNRALPNSRAVRSPITPTYHQILNKLSKPVWFANMVDWRATSL